MRQRRKKDSNKNVEKHRKHYYWTWFRTIGLIELNLGVESVSDSQLPLRSCKVQTDQEEGPYLECNQKGNRLIILEVYILEN